MSQTLCSRDETDSLGTVSIPEQSLYGSNTARALENFPVDDAVFDRRGRFERWDRPRGIGRIGSSKRSRNHSRTSSNLYGGLDRS